MSVSPVELELADQIAGFCADPLSFKAFYERFAAKYHPLGET